MSADGGGDERRSPTATDHQGWVGVLLGDQSSLRTVQLAASIASWTDRPLLLLAPIVGTVDDGIRSDALENAAHRAYQLRQHKAVEIDIESIVEEGPDLSSIVSNAIRRHDIAAMVIQHGDPETATLATSIPCDTILIDANEPAVSIDSVLVGIGGGPHSTLTLQTGAGIAHGNDAQLTLLHVIPPDASASVRETAEEYLAECAATVGTYDRVSSHLAKGDDVAELVIKQAQDYDVIVIGAPQKSRLRRFIFGSTAERIRTSAPTTVLQVRDATGENMGFERNE